MLRIAHVYEPTSGGVPVYVATLSDRLNARGGYSSVSFSGAACADHQIELTRSRQCIPAYREQLLQIFDEHDLVHFHSFFALRWAFPGLRSELADRPFVFQPHALPTASLPSVPVKALVGRLLLAGLPTGIPTACLGTHEEFEVDCLPHLDPFMVGVGIDTDHYVPASPTERHLARESFGLKDEEYVVGFLGRNDRQKGIDLFERLIQESPDIRYLVAGPGLDRLVRFSNVTYVGVVSDSRELLSAVDSVVQTSRWEGASLVALEAQAMGLPVVAFDTPGGSDALGQQSKSLIEPFDIDAMRIALLDTARVQRQGGLADEVSLRQRREEISVERAVDRFDERYRQLIKIGAHGYETQLAYNHV